MLDWSGQNSAYPKRWKGVIAYIALLNVLVFSPVAAVVHWSFNYNLAYKSESNQMKAWLIIYPFMAIMTIGIFIK